MRALVVVVGVLCALPAAAQQQTIVVPADAGVVIRPRSAGGALPVATMRAPRPRLAGRLAPRGGEGLGLADVALPLLSLIPLAAAAALATSLPGGGGHGTASGPTRTR